MRVPLLVLLACAGLLLGQRRLVEDAWDLAAKGHRDEAIRVLHEAIKNDPRDANARLLLGNLLAEAGQQPEAIKQLTEAVRLRPQSAKAQNSLGEAYNSFGNTRAAREPFEKAVAINPGFGAAQVNLGLVLLTAGELEAAAGHLDRAIRILGRGDDAAYAYYLRAKVYTAQDEAQKAAAQLQQAVSIRPDFPEAWSDLGEARKTLLDDAGALAAFQRAVNLAPGDAVAQYRLGAEYLSQGHAHLAVERLEQAYRLKPEDQSTLSSLVIALRQAGNPAESDSFKQKLSELLRKKDQATQNAVAATQLNNEGAKLQKAGDLGGALAKYRQALSLYPESVGMRVNYAVALLRLGQWTEGLNQLHDALLRDPSNAKIRAALKDALAQAPAGSVPSWKDEPF